MTSATIIFSCNSDLNDFFSVVDAKYLSVNVHQLTVNGEFEEADLELAKAAFQATVIETPPGE